MSELRIFVSHTAADVTFCRELVAALRDAGADVWYDEHNLGSGQLGRTIELELESRSAFVVILSPAALQSAWVEEECRMAHYLRRKDASRVILPVLADAVAEDDIWLFMREYKRVEAPGGQAFPRDEAIRRALSSLALSSGAIGEHDDAAMVEELLGRGQALNDAEKYREALPFFERAVAIAPERSDAWFGYAYALAELKRWREAVEAYDRVVELSPDDAGAYNNKANILNNLHRYEEALEAYDRATELSPEDPMYWANRGNVLFNLERYQDALASYNRALAIDPTNETASNGKADASKQIQRALEQADMFGRRSSKEPWEWYELAEAQRKLQRYEAAITSYSQAIQGGSDLKYLIGRARTYEAMGRFSAALSDYDAAIRRDSHNLDLWGARARVLRKLNRIADAEQAERIAQGIDQPTTAVLSAPASSSSSAATSSAAGYPSSSSGSSYTAVTSSSSPSSQYTPSSSSSSQSDRKYDKYDESRSGLAFAIFSLLFAVAGLCSASVLSVVGIILGHVALRSMGRYQSNRWMAILGLILGYLGVAHFLALTFNLIH